MAFSLQGMDDSIEIKKPFEWLSKEDKDFLTEEVVNHISLPPLTNHQIGVFCTLLNEENKEKAVELSGFITNFKKIVLSTNNIKKEAMGKTPELVALMEKIQTKTQELFSEDLLKKLEKHTKCEPCNAEQLENACFIQ